MPTLEFFGTNLPSNLGETIHCDSASDFVKLLRASNPRWQGKHRGFSDWGFRGQREDWPLLPSAWRPSPFLERYKTRIVHLVEDTARNEFAIFHPIVPEEHRERAFKLYLSRTIELELLREFMMLANAEGHELPVSRVSFLASSDVSRDELLRRLTLDFGDDSLPTALGLAQHHGIPTRFLDWSSDPMTAAFFASDYASDVNHLGDRIVVWAYRANLLHYLPTGYVGPERHTRESPETPLFNVRVFRPPYHSNSFLRAQRGFFTICDLQFGCIERGSFPSLIEHLATNSWFKGGYNQSVVKITLGRSEVPELLRLLQIEGYTKARMMPRLESVAATLQNGIMRLPDDIQTLALPFEK